MSEFTVGVFEHERASGRVFLMAYVRYFNPDWPGCCVHHTIAETGAHAKDNAKAQHRRECMAGRSPQPTSASATPPNAGATTVSASQEVGAQHSSVLKTVAAEARAPQTTTSEHKPECAKVSHRRSDDDGVTFAWPAKDCTCGLDDAIRAPQTTEPQDAPR